MFPDAHLFAELTRLLRRRFGELRRGEAGYSTEAVVVIALLVAMAITAVAIIAAKVLATAKGISTG